MGGRGETLPDGETGHICFQGPQTFLGYAGDAQATARTISRDGVLYTGDVGFRREDGLHFSGRASWIIKPAGHQVFPGDVENHFCGLGDKVASCAVVGAEHHLLSEAIVGLRGEEARRDAHCRGTAPARPAVLASFMRPLHYIVLEPGQMPLNRAAKSDYLRLRELASEAAEQLGWRTPSVNPGRAFLVSQ